ncbi:MAG: NAD-dependent epimerase/dehydratase family protein [Clostridiales Family XIII bacterium]|jgi:nucleoside-diphosphate-sugar epimerase|nr:NAD-dependent epimerase/dehydratase family protein [Clostridiales Family XIII bacterium]
MNRIVREDVGRLLTREYDTGGLNGATVLIAGANSQIARFLTYLLIELSDRRNLGMRFVLLARDGEKAAANFADYRGREDVTLIAQDIAEPLRYEGTADVIFHSGGSSSPYHYLHDPVGIVKANALGTINVLDYAARHAVKHVVFASSREVYGDVRPGTAFIREEDCGVFDHMKQRNCYPESKRLAESAFAAYAAQYGVPYSILRIASVYGPGMIVKNDGRAIADIVAAAADRRDIVLTGPGTVVRGYCYISDIADGILRVMSSPAKNQIYNLSNETELMPLRDIASLAAGLFPERNIGVVYADPGDAPLKGAYSAAAFVPMDTSKIENLGWKPAVKLADGLRRTIVSYDEDRQVITPV